MNEQSEFYIFDPKPRRRTFRPRRYRGRQMSWESIAWEAGKILLGGLAGLACGQLMLWWLPLLIDREPIDPFKAAILIRDTAPELVPPALRRRAQATTNQGDKRDARSN